MIAMNGTTMILQSNESADTPSITLETLDNINVWNMSKLIAFIIIKLYESRIDYSIQAIANVLCKYYGCEILPSQHTFIASHTFNIDGIYKLYCQHNIELIENSRLFTENDIFKLVVD